MPDDQVGQCLIAMLMLPHHTREAWAHLHHTCMQPHMCKILAFLGCQCWYGMQKEVCYAPWEEQSRPKSMRHTKALVCTMGTSRLHFPCAKMLIPYVHLQKAMLYLIRRSSWASTLSPSLVLMPSMTLLIQGLTRSVKQVAHHICSA